VTENERDVFRHHVTLKPVLSYFSLSFPTVLPRMFFITVIIQTVIREVHYFFEGTSEGPVPNKFAGLKDGESTPLSTQWIDGSLRSFLKNDGVLSSKIRHGSRS
jgi:hypothetical protein